MRDLRNLGPVTEAWLVDVGIPTPAELERVGPLEAWRRLKDACPRAVTRVALWALAGALLDLDWREVPPDLKRHLEERLPPRSTRHRRVVRESAPRKGGR